MFWFIAFLVILAIYLGSPAVKGRMGEYQVKSTLKKLDIEKYIVLNDLFIANEKGETTQIDHVVISVYGIFVIETKNYKGWITGNKDSLYWKQTIYKRKEKLFNPIKQNKAHINKLKELLNEYPDVPFISIVAFSNGSTFKFDTPYGVMHISDVLKFILSYEKPVITFDEVEIISEIINKAKIEPTREAKAEHIKRIKTEKTLRESKIENDICPYCDGELVLRKSQYGEFKGCRNYPKCKFTYNLY